MAPADSELNEKAFRKIPLDFVGNSILRWGGDKSTQLEFNTTERGWETSIGTMPAGSMWRKNPVRYGVQCAVCSMQCAICSVQYAVCSMQCAVCSVQCAVCSVQCAVCSVQFSVCRVQCEVVCSVQCAVCNF